MLIRAEEFMTPEAAVEKVNEIQGLSKPADQVIAANKEIEKMKNSNAPVHRQILTYEFFKKMDSFVTTHYPENTINSLGVDCEEGTSAYGKYTGDVTAYVDEYFKELLADPAHDWDESEKCAIRNAPARFRLYLTFQLWLTVLPKGSMPIFTRTVFESIVQRLNMIPITLSEVRDSFLSYCCYMNMAILRFPFS